MTYTWDFAAVLRFKSLFVSALGTTVTLSLLVVLFGVLFGMVLTSMRRASIQPLSWLAIGIIEVVRAVPPLVIIVWLYYCLPILTGLSLSKYMTAVVALSLYSAAFYAEIFRAGVQSIDRGLIEAGQSVGMGPVQIFTRIVGPLSFQRVLPPFVSQCVLVIKNTSLAGYIAVTELLYQGQKISMEVFRPLEVLSIVALVYIALIVPLSTFATLYERHYRRRYGL